MHLELATWDHYNAIQDMVLKFAKASPYAATEVDEAKAANMIVDFIERPIDRVLLVAMDGKQPVGMLAGVISEFILSRERIASELIWWMEPDYRKSRIAFEMIEAYEFWAAKLGCSIITLSTVETEQTDRIQKYYSRKGYHLVERSFIKEI
jgi:GNAT superfamily N-acetyltransferase